MRFFTFIMISLFIHGIASAEVVTLTSGKQIEGRIIQLTDRKIQVQTPQNVTGIPLKMIKDVEDSPSDSPMGNSGYLDDVLVKLNKGKAIRQTRDLALQNKIHSKKIELYMAPWCPYCVKMEKYLDKLGVKYTRYNIQASSSARQRYKSLGEGGIPLVKIGDKIIRGYNPGRVWSALTQ